MEKKDPRIDTYIGKAAPFAQPILKHLRKVIHAGCPQVVETIKWNRPSFEHHGLLCAMAAFQRHCIFHFWKRELLGASGELGTIKSLEDLPNEKTLVAYVRKAAELNEKGIKPAPQKRAPKKTLTVPPDLAAALAKNKKAQQTFENFQPEPPTRISGMDQRSEA